MPLYLQPGSLTSPIFQHSSSPNASMARVVVSGRPVCSLWAEHTILSWQPIFAPGPPNGEVWKKHLYIYIPLKAFLGRWNPESHTFKANTLPPSYIRSPAQCLSFPCCLPSLQCFAYSEFFSSSSQAEGHHQWLQRWDRAAVLLPHASLCWTS